MNNLSEEIIAKFLMGKCTEEELVQVNLWIKESDENARKLFRMEEIYHLGKEKHTVSPKRMDQAERSLYKRLAIEEAKQNRTLAIHRWMKYAAIITVILLTGYRHHLLDRTKCPDKQQDDRCCLRRQCRRNRIAGRH